MNAATITDIIIHPETERRLGAFRRVPVHALLIVGPRGSGKLSLAVRLAEQLLELEPGNFQTYAYGLIISSSDGKAIGIDTVRELEHFLSLRVPSPRRPNRVVIIEDSQLLSQEAQNALLKTLEEPPADTIIILNVSQLQALLPTIRSRAATVNLQRPSQTALQTHFMDQFDEAAVQQAYAISGGLPGLMHALLSDEEHPLLRATKHARQLLSQTVYDRLRAVDDLSRDRALAIDVTFILQQMAHVSLQTASGTAARKWQNVLRTSYAAEEALQNSAQPKLVLTNLMLQI